MMPRTVSMVASASNYGCTSSSDRRRCAIKIKNKIMNIKFELKGESPFVDHILLEKIPLSRVSKICEDLPKLILEQYLTAAVDALSFHYGEEWAKSLLECIKGMDAGDALTRIDKKISAASLARGYQLRITLPPIKKSQE